MIEDTSGNGLRANKSKIQQAEILVLNKQISRSHRLELFEEFITASRHEAKQNG
jgi:hypothetical protein